MEANSQPRGALWILLANPEKNMKQLVIIDFSMCWNVYVKSYIYIWIFSCEDIDFNNDSDDNGSYRHTVCSFSLWNMSEKESDNFPNVYLWNS